MKYQRLTPSGYKDIAIWKSEFVAKTQFLWHSFIWISGDKNIRYNLHESRSRAEVIAYTPLSLVKE